MMKSRSIWHPIKEMVKKNPHAKALVAPMKEEGKYITFTYSELLSRVNQFSRYLVSVNGVQPEDRLVIFTEKSHETVLSTLAAFNIGATAVPINTTLSPLILEAMLAQLGNYHLITQEPLLKTIHPVTTTDPIIVGHSLFDQKLDQFSDDDIHLTSYPPYAYIIYTSGTTGTPKPVLCTHEGLLRVAQSWDKDYHLQSSGQLIHGQMASPGFDVYIGDCARAFCAGGKLVLIPKYILTDPAKLYRIIIETKINIAEFVPAVLNPLMDWMEIHQKTIDHQFLVIFGSDKVLMKTPRRIENYFTHTNTQNINSYGATELYIDSYRCHNPHRSYPHLGDDDPVPIGEPFEHAIGYIKTDKDQTLVMKPGKASILLDRQGRPIPFSEDEILTGELLIGGDQTVASYFNQPELNKIKFLDDPLSNIPGSKVYSTGDQVIFHAKTGALALRGRNTDFIKIGGERIGIGIIRSILLEHPNIQDCYLKASKERHNHLECYIVSDQPIDYDDIVRQLSSLRRGATIAYMTLYTVDGIVETHTANQKISHEIVGNQKPIVSQPIQPKTSVETSLIEYIAELCINRSRQELDKEQIKASLGTQYTLTQLGINAVDTNLLLEKLNKEFQLKDNKVIDYHHVAKYKTIKDIAAFIDNNLEKKEKYSHVDHDQHHKSKPYQSVSNVRKKLLQKGVIREQKTLSQKRQLSTLSHLHNPYNKNVAWNKFKPCYTPSQENGTIRTEMANKMSIINQNTKII